MHVVQLSIMMQIAMCVGRYHRLSCSRSRLRYQMHYHARVGNRATGELQHTVTASLSSALTATLMNVFFLDS
jgi:hypothetical protein